MAEFAPLQPQEAPIMPPLAPEGNDEAAHKAWIEAGERYERESLDKLVSAHPELAEGGLTQDLEDKIFAAGYSEFAVGFNQSNAVSTPQEAAELLDEQGGIELGMYNLDQRFLIHDKQNPSHMYPMGYYGARMGRFVYAFPIRGETAETPAGEASRTGDGNTEHVPEDLYIQSPDGETVVNAKYCAGFIDDQQVFYPNVAFMAETEPAEGSQPEVQMDEKLAAAEDLGGVALANEVSVPNIADVEANRTTENIEVVRDYLEREGLDIGVQTEKFEADVKTFVNQIWEKAIAEGRTKLTDNEMASIRLASEAVQKQRNFVDAYKDNESQRTEVESRATAEQNAQQVVDKLFQASSKRPLTQQERYVYRKAKRFLAKNNTR